MIVKTAKITAQIALVAFLAWMPVFACAADNRPFIFIDEQIAAHQGQTGVYVLETGAEALRARAWLADHAEQSIEVQYFIWSTDNIGILAAEALMRAAKRGVAVRVIADDLLIDADDKTLIALARHPNIEIRIYNSKASVGVSLQTRLLNAVTDLRGLNFQRARKRGVRVRINTNSLASTDNLPAFSGYRNQQKELLAIGIEIYEYKPNAAIQHEPMHSLIKANAQPPITALHAKTMVVDSRLAYIGTFNFDPRSENLNTEAGVIIHNEELAKVVEATIETDMKPENSWNAASDDPDRHVPLSKRSKLQTMPIKPFL
jgi:phosphatidylserine/phosphatidylglycerophosphate/cardiolipin synthase-like enzyme